jgi:chemotaxis signal transduction protein
MTEPTSLLDNNRGDDIPEMVPNHSTRESLLFMRLGDRWFGLPAANVVLIAPKGILTRVPISPPHLLGIASLRGRLMAVIHLENLLGKKPSIDRELPDTLPRLVVVTSGQDELAIVADEIAGIDEQGPIQDRVANGIQGLIRAELNWRGHQVLVLDLVRLVNFAIERAAQLFTQGRIDA